MSPTSATRPANDSVSEERITKRQKTTESVAHQFHDGLMENESLQTIRKAFMESKPYLHCKIDKLMNDDLLRRVRKEIFNELHFTLKETDIYKVKKTSTLVVKVVVSFWEKGERKKEKKTFPSNSYYYFSIY